jgi:hypothetical protein
VLTFPDRRTVSVRDGIPTRCLIMSIPKKALKPANNQDPPAARKSPRNAAPVASKSINLKLPTAFPVDPC